MGRTRPTPTLADVLATWSRRGALTLAVLGVVANLALALFELVANINWSLDTPSGGATLNGAIIGVGPVIGAVLGFWLVLKRKVPEGAIALGVCAAFSWAFAFTFIPRLDLPARSLTLAPGAILAMAAALDTISRRHAPRSALRIGVAALAVLLLAAIGAIATERYEQAGHYLHAVTGRVTDTAGRPVVATVYAFNAGSSCCWSTTTYAIDGVQEDAARTDVDGRFTLRLVRGRYKVAFVPLSPIDYLAGGSAARVSEAPVVAAEWWDDAPSFDRAKSLSVDADVSDVNATLGAGFTVHGEGGPDQAGLEVRVYWETTAAYWGGSSRGFAVAVTRADARGAFTVHLPADRYQFCSYRHVSARVDVVRSCVDDVMIDRDGPTVRLP